MTDLDPEIWNNPTLGSASKLPFLDVLTAQAEENRRAKIEGREPLKAVRDVPEYIPSNSVPSDVTPVRLVEREDPTDTSIEEIISILDEVEDDPMDSE